MSVYLDYNASAPIDERVLNLMIEVYKNSIGNADSRTHNFGENARSIVENARKQVASLLQVKPDEIFFTSGATESNNIAIQGLKEYAEKSNRTLSGRCSQLHGSGSKDNRGDDSLYLRRVYSIGHQAFQLQRNFPQ